MGCTGAKCDPSVAVFRHYEFVELCGTGATSQVHAACCKATGRYMAVKCFVKQEAQALGRTDLGREAGLMRRLEHHSVCRLHATFEDPELFYFVMELCRGGKLFQRLEEEIVLEEQEAAHIGRQMLSALAHIHSRGVVHRDLKPESWIFAEPRLSDPGGINLNPRVKLINFSLAEACGPEDLLTQPCGTLHYVAPEVLKGTYGRPVDVWASGIVIFLATYAAYPFDGESCRGVMQNILVAEPDWSDVCYALSADAKDLLGQMLTKDPHERISAQQAMEHRWFKLAASRGSIANSVCTQELRQSRASKAMSRLSRPCSMRLAGSERFSSARVSAGIHPEIIGAPGHGKRTSVEVTPELIGAFKDGLGHDLFSPRASAANSEISRASHGRNPSLLSYVGTDRVLCRSSFASFPSLLEPIKDAREGLHLPSSVVPAS